MLAIPFKAIIAIQLFTFNIFSPKVMLLFKSQIFLNFFSPIAVRYFYQTGWIRFFSGSGIGSGPGSINLVTGFGFLSGKVHRASQTPNRLPCTLDSRQIFNRNDNDIIPPPKKNSRSIHITLVHQLRAKFNLNFSWNKQTCNLKTLFSRFSVCFLFLNTVPNIGSK